MTEATQKIMKAAKRASRNVNRLSDGLSGRLSGRLSLLRNKPKALLHGGNTGMAESSSTSSLRMGSFKQTSLRTATSDASDGGFPSLRGARAKRDSGEINTKGFLAAIPPPPEPPRPATPPSTVELSVIPLPPPPKPPLPAPPASPRIQRRLSLQQMVSMVSKAKAVANGTFEIVATATQNSAPLADEKKQQLQRVLGEIKPVAARLQLLIERAEEMLATRQSTQNK